MKVGGKLANKLLNVTKFVLAFGGDETGAVGVPIDQAMLSRLSGVIADATAAFDELDYARALERTESFFWWFCDDYVELVKTRAYGAGGVDGVPASGDVAEDSLSARNALTQALSVLQRLFAPHMPFCTDEVWSWWHDTSVHRAAWPSHVKVDASGPTHTSDTDNTSNAEFFLATVGSVLSEIRRCKTEAKVSQRAVVSHVVVACDDARAAAITQARVDLVNAGNVTDFAITQSDSLTVTVTLAPAS
jgi:valyl-tRNA synthetase